jgi:predicted nicotinamide N-methyase
MVELSHLKTYRPLRMDQCEQIRNMVAEQSLTMKLRCLLKEARIVETPLLLTPEIRLYLLSPDYPQEALTDQERRLLMDEPPFWAFCWSSGQVLAKWIRDLREDICGKRVLDFGSGSGIAAIAAALSGAREVIALDADPLSREAILANAELNKVTIATTDYLEFVKNDFDVILAADILYDKSNFRLLNLFNEHSKRVVVADSRVKELPEPYEKIGNGVAVTCPDLDEPKEYRHVGIFAPKSYS